MANSIVNTLNGMTVFLRGGGADRNGRPQEDTTQRRRRGCLQKNIHSPYLCTSRREEAQITGEGGRQPCTEQRCRGDDQKVLGTMPEGNNEHAHGCAEHTRRRRTDSKDFGAPNKSGVHTEVQVGGCETASTPQRRCRNDGKSDDD